MVKEWYYIMSCLIKDTTREQREKIIKDAIALSTLDALPPTDDCMELVQLYIDGKLELSEITTIMISRYEKEHA